MSEEQSEKEIKSGSCIILRVRIPISRDKECHNSVVKELQKARKNFELKLAVDIKRNPKSFYKMFVPKQNLRRELTSIKRFNG